ncbi:hypothetical protein LX36DRAFT_661332 [Colletotrichum falcatum]|nr:hypothetical protein LX36DRAFT_661332 [Colletotrichum falcatum]
MEKKKKGKCQTKKSHSSRSRSLRARGWERHRPSGIPAPQNFSWRSFSTAGQGKDGNVLHYNANWMIGQGPREREREGEMGSYRGDLVEDDEDDGWTVSRSPSRFFAKMQRGPDVLGETRGPTKPVPAGQTWKEKEKKKKEKNPPCYLSVWASRECLARPPCVD